jgi:2-phospho-L-lactate/phosphoenolpyruvate guanylyltransferase
VSEAAHEHITVLIPVKAFAMAKARLAGALAPSERAALARHMATNVVRAAAPHPVAVVCDSDEVARWAEDLGATVLWRPGLGLNAAVEDGVASLGRTGVDRVVVAHGDLIHARCFDAVLGLGGIVFVPDRHGDGTNVVSLPTTCGFRFAYGAGSFARHLREAERLDLPHHVVHDASLAWDVDFPTDLQGAPDA